MQRTQSETVCVNDSRCSSLNASRVMDYATLSLSRSLKQDPDAYLAGLNFHWGRAVVL
jgi:hypothetical protein